MSRPKSSQQTEMAALGAVFELDTAEMAALLAESAPPVAPEASIKSRLMSRVSAYEVAKPIADVRRNEATWTPYGAPGIDIKPLFRDELTGRTTLLMRMAPGSRYPAHHHHDVEQCLVVSGDVRFGDLVYEEGDFVVMGKSTDHPEIHSVNGNVLLLVAGRTEFLGA